VKVPEAVTELTRLGYRFELAGERLRYQYAGQGSPDPSQVIPLLEVIKTHKHEVQRLLSGKQPSLPERVLSCVECPWYQANPWTYYPELPAWCHHHMDGLLTDNPPCISYRRGEIPPREKP
jgi:hypothetical protein